MNSLNQKLLTLHLDSKNELTKRILKRFIQQSIIQIGQQQCNDKVHQFSQLFKKLCTFKKLQPFNDKNHRLFVIQLIKHNEISLYNPSYLNRAKITNQTLRLLKEVGPYLFTQGIVIVSKLNTIQKHFSRRIIEDNLYNEKQDIIWIKIKEILKTCTQKKRSINNNFKKLQMLFQDTYNRVELIKQLGKLLRDAWKQDKMSKNSKLSNEQNQKDFMMIEDKQKQEVKRVINYNIDIDEAHLLQEDLQRKSLSQISLHSFKTVKYQQDGSIFGNMLQDGIDLI